MTKQFCDICDKPAHGETTHTIYPLDRPWSGTKCTPGSPNPTDGKWRPIFDINAVFIVEDLNVNDSHRRTPDLCRECKVMLLQNLIASIK